MTARETALAACSVLFGVAMAAASAQAAESRVAYRVENGAIAAPLTGEPGDAERGRAVALSRDAGNCFLCHDLPDAGSVPTGDMGPPLAGVGGRLTTGELRLRLVDSTRINQASVMPAYYRIRGLRRVAAAYRDRPILSAQQIEDVIAYLARLRD